MDLASVLALEGRGLKESSLSAYTLHFPLLEISGGGDFIKQGLVGKRQSSIRSVAYKAQMGGCERGKYAT